MLQKFAFGILILCFGFLYVGCSGNPIQEASRLKPAVSMATPEKGESSLSDEYLELKNCDGKADLHRSLAAEKQVASRIAIAAEAASATTGGKVALSTEMKASLEKQVQRAYQSVIEEAKTSVEQTELVVPLGKIRTFKIYWAQEVFSSTVSFKMDDAAYTAAYTCTLDIPRSIIHMETGCTA